eukprot:scaffold389238_cov16-Prasinocladus_malaysianus.AAC.1
MTVVLRIIAYHESERAYESDLSATYCLISFTTSVYMEGCRAAGHGTRQPSADISQLRPGKERRHDRRHPRSAGRSCHTYGSGSTLFLKPYYVLLIDFGSQCGPQAALWPPMRCDCRRLRP